ncbi:MAG: amidohydrolase family protein [Pseudomonadota bacterium]
MTHDLVIRGGRIVDGTGAEPFNGDVAVDGDTIVGIGKVAGSGKREIDASGLVVSPGFIDLHTHFDAQIGWEPELRSVSWHGVTTALMGNCGVTFAPCRKSDRELLASMMETVEDIPREAILEGLPWTWESYGEYLDTVESLGPTINVAGMVGHCATRFYVMGERAIEEPGDYRRGWTPLTRATAEEIEKIAKLAAQSVKEGAIGFSTNRLPGHRLPDTRSIPGTFAHRDELRAVARAVGQHGGIMQTVTDFKEFDEEMELIADEARLAGSAIFSAPTEAGISALDEKVRAMRQQGLNVTALTCVRSGGGLGCLANDTFFNFFRSRAWQDVRSLAPADRLAALRNPETRARLINDARQAMPDPNRARNWFWLGDGSRPNYTRSKDDSITSMAHAAGVHPVEMVLRLMDESNGQAMFHLRGFNVELDEVAELICKDWALPSLGDAGAHVTGQVDAGWATFVLSHWHRDTGIYTLPEAVRRLSGAPAAAIGLADRGVLAVGKRADINVFDIENLAERQPQLVYDFPGGAARFTQRAQGYKATVCNGRVTLLDDELTGERGGRVLRSTDL